LTSLFCWWQPLFVRARGAMPYVSSSGRKLFVEGPRPSSSVTFAHAVVAAAILLSLVALVRLGGAAAAAVAAVTAPSHTTHVHSPVLGTANDSTA
jgi:hypothetical protein